MNNEIPEPHILLEEEDMSDYKKTTLITIDDSSRRRCILQQLGHQSWVNETDEGLVVTHDGDDSIYRDRVNCVWQLRNAYCPTCSQRGHPVLTVVREAS